VSEAAEHRLDGLEPDNPLAFLALLGLLRALEEVDGDHPEEDRWWPRAGWTVEGGAWRPILRLTRQVDRRALCSRLTTGIRAFRDAYAFPGYAIPNFPVTEYRVFAEKAEHAGGAMDRRRLDVLAAIATDQIPQTKGSKKSKENDEDASASERVSPTPLCLVTGQGHQKFLPRLASAVKLPEPQGERDPNARSLAEELEACLFARWRRADREAQISLRWDPGETARQALMAGDPTDNRYKQGSETGAYRLAAIGLSVLPVLRDPTPGADTGTVPGGATVNGEFALHWPIWTEPASLAAIRALLVHPDLLSRLDPPRRGGLRHLGVVAVYRTSVLQLGQYKSLREGTLV
jgi:hypothetical protein